MTAIEQMNWMQVEQYLKTDDRCILPLGSTEQHAYLSLCVDNILPWKLAHDAVGDSGVPVFPVLPYGITPYFRAYPGSINIRVQTYLAVVRDILDDLHEQGFRRILIVNGHGGNTPAQGFAAEWMADHPGTQVKFHNWWNAPGVWAQVQATDANASHASWMENFPWTRLEGVTMPDVEKTGIDLNHMRLLDPKGLREYLAEGNFGGRFQRPDGDMHAIWDVAVAETRALLEGGWAG
ncbi:creatininase family protein [Deinococcus marmoris]|uniref:creatininase family protein n=1 Tax=Deinococcus marmoris TaxID=249408 RepID=UPI000A7EE026|nr:creatininase family protein [Deinococcus marmoris]